MFNRITPVVKNILLVNVGIFLIQSFLKLPLSDIFGLRVVFADDFAPYQFLTYMWIHGNFGHLLGNMFAVFIFGPILEQVWGPKRFFTFYLITGIGAAAIFGLADFAEKYPMKKDADSYLANPNPDDFSLFIVDHKSVRYNVAVLADFADEFYDHPTDKEYIAQSREIVKVMYTQTANVPMIGASGAVFGILMAFAMLFPNMQLMLLFPPIPIRAKYLVFFYAMFEIYSEINRSAGDNVAHLAHIGGMLIAFILLKFFWHKTSNNRYY
jgi:membrane associated rhomboid family serine protease